MATDGQPETGVVPPSHSTRPSPTPENPPRAPSPVRPSLLRPFFTPEDAFDASVEAPGVSPKLPSIVPGHVASSFTFGGRPSCLAPHVVRSCWFRFRFLSSGGLLSVPGVAAGPHTSKREAFGSAFVVVARPGSSLADRMRSCWGNEAAGLVHFSGKGGPRSLSNCPAGSDSPAEAARREVRWT
jgi:hypothetical protein